jgi:uncharacterized protein YbjT (DUF2867 family)
MGATGQVGGKIVRLLIQSGETVRALGRSQSKLAELKHIGAEVRAGEAEDVQFLTDAFTDADAVFIMVPSDPTASNYKVSQDRLAESIVQAVANSNVRNVVCLSSIGADQPTGTGYITDLHTLEQRLRTLPNFNVLLLRPGYFFENFYSALSLIKNQGINGDSLSPDVPVPMVATRDIAGVAAAALKSRDWTGVEVRELPGPRDLSLSEVTRLIGNHIGVPDLPYVQFPDDDMAAGLIEQGLSEEFAALHIETTRAISNGTIRALRSRTDEDKRGTPFEDFAAELAEAYKAM